MNETGLLTHTRTQLNDATFGVFKCNNQSGVHILQKHRADINLTLDRSFLTEPCINFHVLMNILMIDGS